MGIIRCTCCQAEITAPQFHNGYPYGYTCIKKFSEQKRVKRPMSLADSFNIIGDRATSGRLFVIAKLDGKRIESVVYVNTQNGSMKGEKLIITADNQCMVYTDK